MLQCPNCGTQVLKSSPWCLNCGAVLIDTSRNSNVSRGWAKAATIAGGLMSVYFLLCFSISAPNSTVVNLGLMNDRIAGMVFGAALLLGGLIVLSMGKAAPPSILVPAPPPMRPSWFNFPLPAALMYALPPAPKATKSFPVWKMEVQQYTAANRIVFSPTPSMLNWGYGHGLTASQFIEAVAYIEALRVYHASARALPGPIP